MSCFFLRYGALRDLHSFPTRRSSDLRLREFLSDQNGDAHSYYVYDYDLLEDAVRSEEHTSELQSQSNLVCRLLLEQKKPHDPPERERGEEDEHHVDLPTLGYQPELHRDPERSR